MLQRLRLLPLLFALALPACSAQNGQAERTGQTQVQNIPPTPSPSGQTATRDAKSGLGYISASQLPREGQQMLKLIAAGGPFRYSKDGVTFGNREGVLPKAARGYYREYTVRTPGESDRGARRIVCGGQPETSTAECYYTADHYASFRRIRP